jgi:AmiR/NasT family two-component response regulator
LIQQQNLSEAESFEMMRNAAMAQGRTLAEIAKAVITAAQLKVRQT